MSINKDYCSKAGFESHRRKLVKIQSNYRGMAKHRFIWEAPSLCWKACYRKDRLLEQLASFLSKCLFVALFKVYNSDSLL